MTIQPLIFYDIPGNAWANKAWSPNCWSEHRLLTYHLVRIR